MEIAFNASEHLFCSFLLSLWFAAQWSTCGNSKYAVFLLSKIVKSVNIAIIVCNKHVKSNPMGWMIFLNFEMSFYTPTIVIFQHYISFRLALEIGRKARLSESPQKNVLLAIQFIFPRCEVMSNKNVSYIHT